MLILIPVSVLGRKATSVSFVLLVCVSTKDLRRTEKQEQWAGKLLDQFLRNSLRVHYVRETVGPAYLGTFRHTNTMHNERSNCTFHNSYPSDCLYLWGWSLQAPKSSRKPLRVGR